MNYAVQKIIAQVPCPQGITLILKEGLNYPEHPELVVILPKDLWDEWDDESRFIYDMVEKKGGCLFWAEDPVTGVVRFFAHSGKDQNDGGFGGSTYNLPMRDGSVRTLKGPWSSRSSIMNKHFPPSHEVVISGRYRMASAMTVERINELLYPAGWRLVRDFRDTEASYKFEPMLSTLMQERKDELEERLATRPSLVGLSLSLCVKDILFGIISYESVSKIVSQTAAATPEQFEDLLLDYCKVYWRDYPQIAKGIARRLRDEGKFIQPRLLDDDYSHSTHLGGEWYELNGERWGRSECWVEEYPESEPPKAPEMPLLNQRDCFALREYYQREASAYARIGDEEAARVFFDRADMFSKLAKEL